MGLVLEVGKFYRNRGGQKIRIICTDAPSPSHPNVGLTPSGYARSYREDGYAYSNMESIEDLVSEWVDVPLKGPKRRVQYVNIYRDYTCGNYPTREEADKGAAKNRIECLRFVESKKQGKS